MYNSFLLSFVCFELTAVLRSVEGSFGSNHHGVVALFLAVRVRILVLVRVVLGALVFAALVVLTLVIVVVIVHGEELVAVDVAVLLNYFIVVILILLLLELVFIQRFLLSFLQLLLLIHLPLDGSCILDNFFCWLIELALLQLAIVVKQALVLSILIIVVNVVEQDVLCYFILTVVIEHTLAQLLLILVVSIITTVDK